MTIRTPGRHRRPGRRSAASHLTRSAAIAATSTGLFIGSAVTATAAPVLHEPATLAQDGAPAPVANPQSDVLQGLIEAGLLTDRVLTLDSPAQALAAPADVDPEDFGVGGFTAVTVVQAVETEAQSTTPEQEQAQAAVAARTETSASRSEQRTQPAASAVAAQPAAPQPAAPQPVAPQPAPQPVAPQPVAPQPVAPQPAPPASGGAAVIASGLMGIPYAYAGSSPSTGFDCSGFTRYVYAQLGISLPHSSAAQQAMATPVSNPVPGDLVFFGSPAWHVGIYAGNGMIYHATNPGSVSNYMSISSIYGSVSGYGRVG